MSTTDCAGNHVCEPDRWPTSMDETWTCVECGRGYVAFHPDDIPWLLARPGIAAGSIGWRSIAAD